MLAERCCLLFTLLSEGEVGRDIILLPSLSKVVYMTCFIWVMLLRVRAYFPSKHILLTLHCRFLDCVLLGSLCRKSMAIYL